MKVTVEKFKLVSVVVCLLFAVSVSAQCYKTWVRKCGACTLTEKGNIPAVQFSCTDPGDSYITYKMASSGLGVLRDAEWDCAYSCLGVDPSGMLTKPLPIDPPSACDFHVSTYIPMGPACPGS